MGGEFCFVGREEVGVGFYGVHGVAVFLGCIAFFMLWVLVHNRHVVNRTRKTEARGKGQREGQRGGSSMSSNDGLKGMKSIWIIHFAFGPKNLWCDSSGTICVFWKEAG